MKNIIKDEASQLFKCLIDAGSDAYKEGLSEGEYHFDKQLHEDEDPIRTWSDWEAIRDDIPDEQFVSPSKSMESLIAKESTAKCSDEMKNYFSRLLYRGMNDGFTKNLK
jgi:hypothetical protein